MAKEMKAASEIGRSSRQRGQSAERDVCALLNDALGTHLKRNLGQERDSGADITFARYGIQVKYVKSLNISKAWEQACIDAEKGELEPLVFHRKPGEHWKVTMDANEFIRLLREAM